MTNFESEKSSSAKEKLIELTVERAMNLPAVKRAFEKLYSELSKKYPELAKKFPETILPYHGPHHSRDVLREAITFALEDGSLGEKDLELLAIAAAFHDAGFVVSYEDNEKFAAEIARAAMKELGYGEEDTERVVKAILSTRVKFEPGFTQLIEGDDVIAKILADADVGNFGRDDSADKSEDVFQELLALSKLKDTPEDRKDFLIFRKRLLQTHIWQTAAAQKLRGEKERKNLADLENQSAAS